MSLTIRGMPMPLNAIRNLIVIPTKMELDIFISKHDEQGMRHEVFNLGNLELAGFLGAGTAVVQGGLGKTQFGVQTQYCIDKIEGLEKVLCVGASGGLKEGLILGDVVVGTETIEHDIRKHGRSMMPRFSSDEAILKQFRVLAEKQREFKIHFGPLASGDEDIMTEARKHELREQTGAISVAWEGAGAARACRFSNLPFVEVRGICDLADKNAEKDFFVNLDLVMSHLAEVTIDWVLNGNNG